MIRQVMSNNHNDKFRWSLTSWAVALRVSRWRPVMYTVAPALQSCKAMPRPIPLEAPVTTHTWPFIGATMSHVKRGYLWS